MSSTCRRAPSTRAKATHGANDVAAAKKVVATERASTKKAAEVKALHRKAEATRKAEEEKWRNNVRKRAAAALAAEDNNSDNSDSSSVHASPKKKKHCHVSPMPQTSAPCSFSPNNDSDLSIDVDTNNADSNVKGNGNGNSDTEDHLDSDGEDPAQDVQHGSDLEDAQEEGEEKDDGTIGSVQRPVLSGNGMNVEKLSAITPAKSGRHRASQKVTRLHFTPISLSLAEKAKRTHRQRICTEDSFPTDKDAFTHKSLCLAAVTGFTNDILKDKLKQIETDVESQNRIFQYVNYAVGGIHSDIKSKAKTMLSGHYKIPGALSKQEIQEAVAWLTVKRLYIYDDLNVKERTYSKETPYRHPIFIEILQAQFCSGSGHLDRDTLSVMVSQKEVPTNLIALIATAIDVALAEWISGEYRQVEFSDDVFASRYDLHCKALKKLTEKAPTYMSFVKQSMLSSALLDPSVVVQTSHIYWPYTTTIKMTTLIMRLWRLALNLILIRSKVHKGYPQMIGAEF
ncbi:hypothetical protein FISHEDRAFT_59844 [Fistulina hepatica ATCC 64428]|uniref:DUF6532 domain-containing protein n=1 Tax=Fistulina hepatica ATCC 64428 TaxID=1128425 RepID=A0A0D7A8L8_9AGAR|nr:hypothetical protein FISHEDRAFT_59844 [Fistulina hepatica ATCC 64428]